MTPSAQALYDEDIADGGFVWNVSRLWGYQPETMEHLFDLMSEAFTPSGLSFRQRGILVAATASTLGDSYCSLAWGGKLAGMLDFRHRPPRVAHAPRGIEDEVCLGLDDTSAQDCPSIAMDKDFAE